MKLLGFELSIRRKDQAVYPAGPWYGIIREPFSGAWQKNICCESPKNLMAFSAIYASVSMIADDISKLRPKLMEFMDGGTRTEENRNPNSPLSSVLIKPNRYQTRIQFYSQWMTSKLLWGNTYVWKERDQRGVVISEYILDPRLCHPLIADDGSVWYELRKDLLSGVENSMRVPAEEIIHDRMITPWHPLIGLTPIYAAGATATQGIRIQANSERFFANMSRPSGQLTSDGIIPDATAKRLKEEFEKNFSAENMGRLFVTGSGLKYEPIAMPASDAQLIEQLKWTVEDVARCFKIPGYKLGLGQPTLNNIGALNQEYYSQTLQNHIEAIELLQDEALGLTAAGYEMEMDLEGLLRMDPNTRAERYKTSISAGWMAPNEARLSENYGPAKGGDSPMLQQQNFSLAALDKRDAQEDPFAPAKPPPVTTPPPAAATPPALPPPPPKTTEIDEVRQFGALLFAGICEDILNER